MFDLEQWMDEHDLSVVRTAPYDKGGRKWILNPCPWNEAHTDGSACIIQFGNGAIAASCRHSSCDGKDWHALRDLLEPGWREHGAIEVEVEEETAFYAGDRHSYDEMLESEPPPVEWLAEGFVPARPIVAFASGPGEGKTWLGLCLGLSIAASKPLFDKYPTKQTGVLYLDAENPYTDMHRRVTALTVGLGLPADSLPFVYRGDVRINLRSADDIARLAELIREERPGVVFIDSLIDFHSADENSAKNVNRVMLALLRIAQDCGVSFVVLHHFRKPSNTETRGRSGGSRQGHTAARKRVTLNMLVRQGKVPPGMHISEAVGLADGALNGQARGNSTRRGQGGRVRRKQA